MVKGIRESQLIKIVDRMRYNKKTNNKGNEHNSKS